MDDAKLMVSDCRDGMGDMPTYKRKHEGCGAAIWGAIEDQNQVRVQYAEEYMHGIRMNICT